MISLENLKNAHKTLKKCYTDYVNNKDSEFAEYICDSCVKRFEYTFETAWKLIKKYLKTQYNKTDEELTMNNIFRYMEGYGFTKNWQNWKLYNEKKNTTAHEYNIEKSRVLVDIIPQFIEDIDYLLEKWDTL